MVLMLAVGSALATAPTPDRPYVSRTGFLVAKDTLEQELGLQFETGTPSRRLVPATLKYSVRGRAEVRTSADLAGIAPGGQPGLEVGAKFRLMATKQDAFALWLNSALPVGTGEAWFGEVHALFSTVLTKTLRLRLNAGLDFIETDGGVSFGGTPLTAAVTYKPNRRVGVFGELAGKAGAPGCGDGTACAYGDVILNGGARVGLTEHLALDAALGYRFLDEQFYVTTGLTANFGRFQ